VWDPLEQIPVEGVFGTNSLVEWILELVLVSPSVHRVPGAFFDSHSATLDLDDEQPVVGVHQYEVGLAVSLPAISLGLPSHRMQDAPGVG